MIEILPGPLQECNTYIISDNNDALIVDPQSCVDTILWKVKKLKVKAILATHGHSDHIYGIDELALNLNVPVMIHPAEQSFLTPIGQTKPDFTIQPVNEGETITIGHTTWVVIHNPGHSPGGISLYCKEEKTLISGDALFHRSIGHANNSNSDGWLLFRSLREKIFTLPDETKVYPGHGIATTIGEERMENPFRKWILEKPLPLEAFEEM